MGHLGRSRWLAIGATLAATALATSCASVDPGIEATRARLLPTAASPTDDATESLPPAAPHRFTYDPEKPPQMYDAFLQAAIDDLQEYWRITYPLVYDGAYEELRGGVHPVYPGKTDTPGCGTPTTRYREIADNAFYCPMGDFIAYDDHGLFPDLVTEIGLAVPAVIMAHEWGHAVQERAGIFDEGWSTVRTEQQADCFAGAWVARVARGESDLLSMSDDDITGGLQGMMYVADLPGDSALDPDAHGSAFDRVAAFQDGFVLGAARCAEYPRNAPAILQLPFAESELSDPDRDFPGDAPYDEIFDLFPADLDRFWSSTLNEHAVAFAPPSVAAFGESVGPPACDGIDVVRNSVTWCPSTNTVVYDDDHAFDSYLHIGDFSIGYLLGVAWGDAVQAAVGSSRVGNARALHSDCLAGAWAGNIVPDPRRSQPLTISAGDLDEAVFTALSLAVESGDAERLGTPFDKIDAFRTGVFGGLVACEER